MSNTAVALSRFRATVTRSIRHDGADKVTSRAKYGVDLRLPEIIFGKVLLTSHSHARIKPIDASRALACLVVLAVATARDLTAVSDADPPLKIPSDNSLVGDKVL